MIASAEGKSLVGGCGIILPRKFLNLEAPKRYFHHLSWDMSPKNRPRIRKWQTIAITITKMTESTEKKIHLQTQFVWRNRSRGGQGGPPPLAIALEWRWLLPFPTKMTLVTHKHCLVLRKSRTRSRHRGQRSLFLLCRSKTSPPPPLSPFLQTTHLDMHSLCFFLKQGLFERSFEKRVIVEKIAHRRTSESTLPCTGTRWGGGGAVLGWASFWVYNILK